MGIAVFIYQIQKKTKKRIEGTGKRLRRRGNRGQEIG
jgi:hypothetical protein